MDSYGDLAPHQRRVVDESQQLLERLEKLRAFMGTNTFGALDQQEQLRLARQLDAMCDYARVLSERIEAFAKPLVVLTDADAAADLAGTPRPDNPTVTTGATA